MPMIPPVATTRMAPRSTFTRRRSRPGTVPWGRSGRPASCAPGSGSGSLGRVCAVASRGSSGAAAVGRLFASGGSPDSEKEVPPRTVLPRRTPASRLDVPRRFAASRCPFASHKALERPRGGGTAGALTASSGAPRAGRVSRRGAPVRSGQRRTAVRPQERGSQAEWARRLEGERCGASRVHPAGASPSPASRAAGTSSSAGGGARFEVDRAVGRCVRAPVAVAGSTCMTPVVFGAAVVRGVGFSGPGPPSWPRLWLR
jgi:hypothetical protein